MENFTVYNPTKLHFGRGVTDEIGQTAKQYGQKVLLISGKGSVVKYGYYNKIHQQLTAAGLEVFEFSGVEPNPSHQTADRAVSVGLEHKIDVIVALGGGSVIDTAKVVSAAIPIGVKTWDVMKQNVQIKSALPLIAVLTLAATGTEMNAFAVLQNQTTGEKIGRGSPFTFPTHSFLDPEFTFTVPKTYTAFGIADLIAHALENYFGFGESPLTDRITADILIEAMHYAPLVLSEPENYDYRANIMWLSTVALNGTTLHGRRYGDWAVHGIGHTLSLLYDTPHGASLSIAYPAWLRLHVNRAKNRIERLSELVFGISSAEHFINALSSFFESIQCPVHLNQIGIGTDKKDEILQLMNKNKVSGMVHKLSDSDRNAVLNLMFRYAV